MCAPMSFTGSAPLLEGIVRWNIHELGMACEQCSKQRRKAIGYYTGIVSLCANRVVGAFLVPSLYRHRTAPRAPKRKLISMINRLFLLFPFLSVEARSGSTNTNKGQNDGF
jgi:hypothetical protein